MVPLVLLLALLVASSSAFSTSGSQVFTAAPALACRHTKIRPQTRIPLSEWRFRFRPLHHAVVVRTWPLSAATPNGNSDETAASSQSLEDSTLGSISSTSSTQAPLTATERILENEKLDPATRAVLEAAAKRNAVESGDDTKPYPIDLPSPVLLAGSMVLAIVSTGSLYELIGGSSSTLPFAATAAIAAIGAPTAIFLLYAAIAKATAETEEDDKKFLSGK